jgi:hypothetical protein
VILKVLSLTSNFIHRLSLHEYISSFEVLARNTYIDRLKIQNTSRFQLNMHVRYAIHGKEDNKVIGRRCKALLNV